MSVEHTGATATDYPAAAALRALEPDFCSPRSLNVNLFSYNVDGEDPKKLGQGVPANQTLLRDFLYSLHEPDIVHFGFQEVRTSFPLRKTLAHDSLSSDDRPFR